MNDSVYRSFRVSVQENASIASTSLSPGTTYAFPNPTFDWGGATTTSPNGLTMQRITFTNAITTALVSLTPGLHYLVVLDDLTGVSAFAASGPANPHILFVDPNNGPAYYGLVACATTATTPQIMSGIGLTVSPGLPAALRTVNLDPSTGAITAVAVPSTLSCLIFSW